MRVGVSVKIRVADQVSQALWGGWAPEMQAMFREAGDGDCLSLDIKSEFL